MGRRTRSGYPVAQAAVRRLAVLSLMVLTGCATVTRGPRETLYIKSDPPGATVAVNDKKGTIATCVAPCSVEVKRNRDLTLVGSMEGYLASEEYVWSKMGAGGNAAVLGNVLVGGFIGLGVDAITGSAKVLRPNPATVYLYPDRRNKPDSPPAEAASEPPADSAPLPELDAL